MFIFPMWITPKIPTDCDLPPTLYAMLNSIVNYGKVDKTKIKDLAKEGRHKIFDFDYPLSNNIDKAEFEEMILNHFIMRRLGYETYTSWHIAFENKIKEIMPMYNKIFDSFSNWDIFNSGEDIIRTTNTKTNDKTNTSSNVNVNASSDIDKTTDERISDTPQNQISDVKNGKYVSNYSFISDHSYDQNESTTTGTSNSLTDNNQDVNESIKRTPLDKISIYKQYTEELKSIYSMIYKDLDCLFYQLA